MICVKDGLVHGIADNCHVLLRPFQQLATNDYSIVVECGFQVVRVSKLILSQVFNPAPDGIKLD